MNILQHINKSGFPYTKCAIVTLWSQNDSKQRHHTFGINSNHIDINYALGNSYTFLENRFLLRLPIKKYTSVFPLTVAPCSIMNVFYKAVFCVMCRCVTI